MGADGDGNRSSRRFASWPELLRTELVAKNTDSRNLLKPMFLVALNLSVFQLHNPL